MIGDVILDDLVPKPQHNAATRFGRGDHGKHRAAVKRRKPRQGSRCIKLEPHTSICLRCAGGTCWLPGLSNQILYWEGWSSWQSELH
jgi:hypothetical protein